ncbi:hypothetical protein SAMN05660880_02469 [Luteibacter sp. 22Crub2.1]|nr:hypothetical protein SAMN04515659_1230 [Dyella sp. 333MFSha]SKB75384.1 hypothetical protein SAMN05660880_02469 [Luteibacter sp. 22Crub2.1]
MHRTPRGDWKGMKKSEYKFATWPLACLLLFASACRQETTAPAPGDMPVRRAFYLDKAGSTLTVDFWLREGDADLSRHFMVAVEHPHILRNVTRLIGTTTPTVHAEIWRVSGEKHAPIDIFNAVPLTGACRVNVAKTRLPSGSFPSELHLHPFVGDEVREGSVLGSFCADGYGHYVARIKTVLDLDWLKNVPTEIVIGQAYNTAK